MEQDFRQLLFPIYVLNDLELSSINSRGIFVPVAPLFDGRADRLATKKQLPGSLTKALTNVKTMISVGSASAIVLNDNNAPAPHAGAGAGVGLVNVPSSLKVGIAFQVYISSV